MFLVFDTETTGLPRDWNAPKSDLNNWPRVVQLAWQLYDAKGQFLEAGDMIVRPDGFTIPFNATKVHGITTEYALENGHPIEHVLSTFSNVLKRANILVGHNLNFDITVLGVEYLRYGLEDSLEVMPVLDTCTEDTAALCCLPGGKGGKFKLPNLAELHMHLFGESFDEAHNAAADVEATARCFLELLRIGSFSPGQAGLTEQQIAEFQSANPSTIQAAGVAIRSNKQALVQDNTLIQTPNDFSNQYSELAAKYAHLRAHSTYSILNSTITIKDLVQQAAKLNMPAVGLTDTGNLMGAFEFIDAVQKVNQSRASNGDAQTAQPLKAILGTEFYLCRDHKNKSNQDNGYILPVWAKNHQGYKNMSMLSSASFTEGFYYVPRIDKHLLLSYKDGLMISSGSLQSEVPSLWLNVGEQQAEEALLWYKTNFGEDFYIEINRHELEEEEHLNKWLIAMSNKHAIKIFPSNLIHYLNREDADVHDFLLCIKDNSKKSDPIGRGYGHRFGFPNDEFFFKPPTLMAQTFSDIPEAFDTITEIIEKTEQYSLRQEVRLPVFEIPEAFNDPQDALDNGIRGQNKYLRHLAYEGAKKRYGEIRDDVKERLEFELETISKTGYPGYFLIVQDLIENAKRMGVWVGPGRGSAAGSLVAYCIGITNVDPLSYGLLFERFLNPERISMPDIDIDFDDKGRAQVIEYVTRKYGQNKVAQLITFGTLGTKSAVRDVGRALNKDQIYLNKLVASTNNVTLGDFFELNDKKLKEKYRPEQIDAGFALIRKMEEQSDEGRIFRTAHALEGLVRNTSIHPCGIVITPNDLRELVPVTVSKDSNLWATQFDLSVAEAAGLLKIDFLGLTTLSLIRDTIAIIQKRHNISIDPDSIPLDDAKTYELFQKGEMVGVFQYESTGMQKYLKDLKPTSFTDLIAMNALYRPGPMAYIPSYINRKHGREVVSYDLPEMREILEETYGITVYQEQVMLLSQKLAGFTRGEADTLRKAMGKKNRELLDNLYSKFIQGGKGKGHPEEKLNKIWHDWLAFANYAFNKSHSTCYALIGFQTAYLKAHYPAEFMAAVLSHNLDDIKKVNFFMEECRRMKLKVLGPDINESEYSFTVNKNGEIRFGLGAIKNIGEAAVNAIIEERTQNGRFASFSDFLTRSNPRSMNKRTIESLVMAGAFDSFEGVHRAQFFHREGNEGSSFLEKAMRWAEKVVESRTSSQFNLFGEAIETQIADLPMPQCDPWPKAKELQMELETIGFYVSAHPMDAYKFALRYFANTEIQKIVQGHESFNGKKVSFGGQLVSVEHLLSLQNKPYGKFRIEDHAAGIDLTLHGEAYLKYKHLLVVDTFLMVHATMIPSYRNRDLIEPKVTDLELLDQVFDRSNKSVVINLDLNYLTSESQRDLSTLLLDNPGHHRVKINLIDKQNHLTALVSPKRLRVDAGAVLPKLARLPAIKATFE
jgi:DNA polymerase-3 subunit alpha